MHIILDNRVDTFSGEISRLTGINAYDCYQCGKCAAGCTVAPFLNETPTKILRYIQLNLKELVMQSQTPYVCASCNICASRCPMEIDITRLMESIRILAAKEGRPPAEKHVRLFSDMFLSSVKMFGRVYELGMTATYNLRNMTPFKDASLAPKLLQKGKLSIFPKKIKSAERIKKIFNKADYF